MNLLNKLTKKIQYSKPEADLISFESEDILTTSAISDIEEMQIPIKPEKTVFQKYPEGLPLTVLEYIDYSKFGALLKQERLLPPSYHRSPNTVEIDGVCDKPRVILTFNSTTSESVRIVSIYGYFVSSGTKQENSITLLQIKHDMSEVWQKFAQDVMRSYDRGYRYALLDHERRGDAPIYHVDETSLKKIREREEERQMAEESARKAREWFKKFD